MRLLISLSLAVATCLLLAQPARAALQFLYGDAPPAIIEDVYLRDGVAFVAIDEVLSILGLSGQWDDVAHVYRFETESGVATISPGSRYLRLGKNFVKVAQKPRFIDGKLRVSEPFLAEQLAPLLSRPLHVRNLDPAPPPEAKPTDNPLEQFFSQLLQQPPKVADDSQWIVAIDPGHGGQDAGAIGTEGSTEQTINLEIALQLQKLLKMRRGTPVIMTRDADYAVGAIQRHEIVARGQSNVLLSLHAQASFSPLAQGVMLFIAPPVSLVSGQDVPREPTPDSQAVVDDSRQLAGALRDALVDAGYQVAPIEERALLPLGQGNLPRVLVEMGYLSNEADLARLRDPVRQALLANALFIGLEAFKNQYQEQPAPHEPDQSTAPQ